MTRLAPAASVLALALAAYVLAVAATAHAALAAQRAPAKHAAAMHAPAKRGPAKPARVVRAVIVSGDGQSAHAYVLSGAKRYESEIANALVVRIPSQPYRKGFFHVVFTCVTKDCSFAPTDQPDDGAYVERVKKDGDDVDNAYDVKVNKGVAALRVTIDTAGLQTVTVRADPVAEKGERAVPASFTLTAR